MAEVAVTSPTIGPTVICAYWCCGRAFAFARCSISRAASRCSVVEAPPPPLFCPATTKRFFSDFFTTGGAGRCTNWASKRGSSASGTTVSMA
jgi:hypothetical protein